MKRPARSWISPARPAPLTWCWALLVSSQTERRFWLAVANTSSMLTIVLLLGVAMAIAVLVDAAASRAREARRAGQEAELLSLFAASVLRGADLNALLERVR